MRSLASLLAVTFAFVSFISLARGRVSMSPGREGDKCKFPDGAVGRCEKMNSCLRDQGFVKRDDTIVLCTSSNFLEIVACCRRPHLVAKAMCSVWASYWRRMTPDGSQTCTSTKPLIHGGYETGLGEYPNMAALGITKENKTHPEWKCGGSLITPSFVLTAGHCFSRNDNPEDWVVGLGEHDLMFRQRETVPRLDEGMPEGLIISAAEPGDLSDFSPVEQWIDVAEIIFYPEYQIRYHDIALLRLKHPAVLTSRVLPACLPTRGPDHYTRESNFTVVGWGNYRWGRPLSDMGNGQKLQKVVIDYIGAVECERLLKPQMQNLHLSLGITTDLICAGALEKDSCVGDSGGPLMRKAELPSDAGHCQPEMVAGIVSFGPIDCGSLGVYIRVSSYIDWITGIVAPGLLPAQAQ